MLKEDDSSVHLRVMIIDDQAVMRKIIRGVLLDAGLKEFLEAENGSDAFDKLTDPDLEYPDIIISDLHMEEMSGTEFIHKLRRNKAVRNPEVPVIVLTGESQKLVLEVAAQVGANAILQKPVSAEQMRETIMTVIGYQFEAQTSNGPAGLKALTAGS